jgi:hypothetical protein
VFLNAFPFQACDSEEWADSIAVAGGVCLAWVVLFPLLRCWGVLAAMKKSGDHRLSVRSSSALQSNLDRRPVARDLYSHLDTMLERQLWSKYRKDMWFWEIVVLLRRLAFALVVSFVPRYSTYLPLAFFSVILVSVMLQQSQKPYAVAFDNTAETVSLGLLLASYFAGLVAQLSSSATGEEEVSSWLGALFLCHGVFVAVLAGKVVAVNRRSWQRFWGKHCGGGRSASFARASDGVFDDVSMRESGRGQPGYDLMLSGSD